MNTNSLIYKLFVYINIKINENNIPLDNEIINTEKYRTNNNFVYKQDILKKNNIMMTIVFFLIYLPLF